MAESDLEFSDEPDTALEVADAGAFSEAVLHSADWTVETIVSQLGRGNIEMNPRFQRRDAWSPRRKSLFVESLILGLPVPQIVLAEKRGERGKYLVLDGKQRLLTLLQFTGNAEGAHNAFRLSGLEARQDLQRKTFADLSDDLELEGDFNALANYTIRTVVIRNWPTFDFLHLVFLRLNTGSVKLSPQELRQAMFPGAFSDFVDDQASELEPLRRLLSRTTPDPRMRDVELLVRFLAFHHFVAEYSGRMKDFLDFACRRLNERWADDVGSVNRSVMEFGLATEALLELFGPDGVARKRGSRSFNRAIFDSLIFYAADPQIRARMLANADAVVAAYKEVLEDHHFQVATESDTAGTPNTVTRLSIWGERLREALGLAFNLPSRVEDADDGGGQPGVAKIRFTGFWGQ
jgi:hypothetical protein